MKKLLSLISAIALLCSSLAISTAAQTITHDNTFTLGDTDKNGRIDARDAHAVKAYTAQAAESELFSTDAADINADGVVNARDTFFHKGASFRLNRLKEL